MDRPLPRRLLTFGCGGDTLAGSLDGAAGTTGVLFAVGGTQTRVGSHRMFENLAKALANNGYPTFRFDRRGVGDSEGEDRGWRDSGADIAAAAAAFRDHVPQITRIIGLGLCDGAGGLCLHGRAAGLDALVLINPWLVEAAENDPAPAALRRHYRERLASLATWKRLLTGSLSYRKAFKGLLKSQSREPDSLSKVLAEALAPSGLPAEWILAEGDATAIAAAHELDRPHWRGLAERRHSVATDSHTFARPGDAEALEAAVLRALARLQREQTALPTRSG